ncbi:Protein of unknown function [Bacillus thuringiensis]|uniref:Uncharacterized protein n=1 Tax=Bacillus thuringiensis TaxID=1428 RepID=A0A1C4F813_BACTU|nr:Protein of unknown function [Bacillus thuringiensis]
MVMESIYN